jgi:hypothetical protein
MAALNAGWDAAGAVAVVADGGARPARLALDAEPHAIRDEVHGADVIVDLAAERGTAAVVVRSGLRSSLFAGTSWQRLARCGRAVVVVGMVDGR